MTRVILWLCLAIAANLHSVPQTLDHCSTDTECQIAADRHCEELGEEEYCDAPVVVEGRA